MLDTAEPPPAADRGSGSGIHEDVYHNLHAPIDRKTLLADSLTAMASTYTSVVDLRARAQLCMKCVAEDGEVRECVLALKQLDHAGGALPSSAPHI